MDQLFEDDLTYRLDNDIIPPPIVMNYTAIVIQTLSVTIKGPFSKKVYANITTEHGTYSEQYTRGNTIHCYLTFI